MASTVTVSQVDKFPLLPSLTTQITVKVQNGYRLSVYAPIGRHVF